MRIIVDTGVLWHKDAVEALVESGEALILPAVVFMERAGQVARHGWDTAVFADRLRDTGFEIEPFGEAEAVRFAVHIGEADRWKRLSRDAMIAGHVRPGDRLWTTNAKDFLEIGVHPAQLMVVS